MTTKQISSAAPETRPEKSRIAARNEAKILDAAECVIAEFGFHGATIDLIADRAGISKPNLHYYFRRKTDLYEAVLHRTLDIWLTSLSKLDPAGDPRIELSRYIGEKLDMAMREPMASRVFANEMLRGAPILSDYLRTDLRNLVRSKSKVINAWVKAGKCRPIDPIHLIFMIWATTQHYADFRPQVTAVLDIEKLTPKNFDQIGKTICSIILDGVLPH